MPNPAKPGIVRLLLTCMLLIIGQAAQAGGQITIAAAADMRFAMDEIVVLFGRSHPDDRIATVYGSSGNFQTQIRQGAPYDLYFSADIAYPRALRQEGYAKGEVRPYALGRIVLWSPSRRLSGLNDLLDPSIRRIAIANPRHAPYGMRAEQALRASGLWDKVQSRLVYGENIAQTAQFVQTGNADAGIIALSLVKAPEFSGKSGYLLISDALHPPLLQGFVITRHAASNPLAQAFADYMGRAEARAVMARYGFVLPQDAK